MRIIAVANQKGGCGKTTTTVNLSAALGIEGKKILVIDFDPQAHTSMAFGVQPEELNTTIYDILMDPYLTVTNALVATNIENVTLLPSNILLSGAEMELANWYGREFVLKKRLEYLSSSFDMCIIDCSPSLNLLTLNALVASREVIIPVQAHYYALEGLKQLLETIDIVKGRFNQDLNILGILLTFVEQRSILSQEIRRQTVEFFGDLVFSTVIRKNLKLAEAPSAGESIFKYDSKSIGAFDYMSLAREIGNEKKNGAS